MNYFAFGLTRTDGLMIYLVLAMPVLAAITIAAYAIRKKQSKKDNGTVYGALLLLYTAIYFYTKYVY